MTNDKLYKKKGVQGRAPFLSEIDMYRRANSLSFSFEDAGVTACNFLQKTTFECEPALLSRLAALGNDWHSAHDLHALIDPVCDFDQDELLTVLIQSGILVQRASSDDITDSKFQTSWDWGLPSALMHFTVQNNPLIPVDALERIQVDKLSNTPQPPLYKSDPSGECHNLPSGTAPVLDIMAKRRTQRDVKPTSISQNAFSDCLFAGLGITGFTSNRAGTLPLKMTPSGGARNPYDAYIAVKSVDGIARGIYQYLPKDHALSYVSDDHPDDIGALLGGQDWLNDMACVVFLCANFERTMWKYSDPNAYRVVLIEAGHIAQNIMLAATDHSLTACPSAALHHDEISALCQIDDTLMSSPIYALGIGDPAINKEVY